MTERDVTTTDGRTLRVVDVRAIAGALGIERLAVWGISGVLTGARAADMAEMARVGMEHVPSAEPLYDSDGHLSLHANHGDELYDWLLERMR